MPNVKVVSMRDKIESDLFACKKAFDQVRIPWIIIDGIVLGYIRHKNIIPWDTDVDVGVFVEVSKKQWRRLHESLRLCGFKIKPRKIDFMYGKRRSRLNMWFFHKSKDGKYYEAFPPTTPNLRFVEKAESYDKPQHVKFLGSVFPMPNNLEQYLVDRYGKDWNDRTCTHEEWRVEKFGTLDQSVKVGQRIWLRSRCGRKGDLWPKILKRK